VARRRHRAAILWYLPRQDHQSVAGQDEGEAHRQSGGLGREPASGGSGGVLKPLPQGRRCAGANVRWI